MVSSGHAGDTRSDAVPLRESGSDPAAFSGLYARHAGTVHAWLRARIEWAASDLTAETFARAWLSRARFRDQRGGSALPWLLGIAANLLADAARHDRIETRARERLGLPVDLAHEDGYTEVEQRLSPRVALSDTSMRWRRASATPWSCASSRSCPTRRWRSGSRSARLPPV